MRLLISLSPGHAFGAYVRPGAYGILGTRACLWGLCGVWGRLKGFVGSCQRGLCTPVVWMFQILHGIPKIACDLLSLSASALSSLPSLGSRGLSRHRAHMCTILNSYGNIQKSTGGFSVSSPPRRRPRPRAAADVHEISIFLVPWRRARRRRACSLACWCPIFSRARVSFCG